MRYVCTSPSAAEAHRICSSQTIGSTFKLNTDVENVCRSRMIVQKLHNITSKIGGFSAKMFIIAMMQCAVTAIDLLCIVMSYDREHVTSRHMT